MLSETQREVAEEYVDAFAGTNRARSNNLLQRVIAYAHGTTNDQYIHTDDESVPGESTLLYTGQDTSRYGTNQFTKVLVHDSVEEIAENAFQFWRHLKEVEFMPSSSLKRIGECAFLCCASLETIDLPATVTFIGKRAFRETALKNIELPPELTCIGEMAFASCIHLCGISIPSSITAIKECAFQHSERLSRLTFEPTCAVEEIEKGAFEYTSLTELIIPRSVKTIGERAFGELRSLQTITFEDQAQVQKIGREAFYACVMIKEISIPASVKKMDAGVFSYNEMLAKIEFPPDSMLEKIPAWAFDGCESLEEITIPKSVRVLEEASFMDLTSLKKVTFEPDSQLRRICEGAFESCTELSDMEIPLGVTHIGDFVFVGCQKLNRIILPRTVVHVGNFCFFGCVKLTEIGMAPTGVTFGNGVFFRCNNIHIVFSTDEDAVHDGTPRRPSTKRSKSAKELLPPTRLEAKSAQALLMLILDGSGRFDGFVASMFNSKIFSFEGLNRQQLDLIVERTIKSRTMQRALKDVSVERGPVFMLMLEGYMNFFLVVTFVLATDEFLRDKPHQALDISVLCLSTYFVAREIFQMGFEIVRYFDNLWNAIDLARIVLVISATVTMMTHDGGDGVEDGVRNLLLATGGFVIFGMVLFLRSTFLPFAEFVGGLVMISRKLLPFLVVSTITVFAFAYMYFTMGFDHDICVNKKTNATDEETKFCGMGVAMQTTVVYFFSGPEETDTAWLDFLFGIVIVVVLLNVVIAIVSDAWETSTEQATRHFWAYRIGFLAEVSALSRLWAKRNMAFMCSEKLLEWDVAGNRRIRDVVNWEAAPYNVAKDDYTAYVDGIMGEKASNVTFSDHEKLKNMGSFERDWYWATKKSTEELTSSTRFNEKPDRSPEGHEPPKPREVIRNLAFYILSLFLGFVTFGLAWPLRVRESIFGFKVDFDEREEEHSNSGIVANVEKLESRLETLEGNMTTMESKLDAILEAIQKKEN